MVESKTTLTSLSQILKKKKGLWEGPQPTKKEKKRQKTQEHVLCFLFYFPVVWIQQQHLPSKERLS